MSPSGPAGDSWCVRDDQGEQDKTDVNRVDLQSCERGAVELGGFVTRWLKQRDVGDEVRLDVIDNLYFEPPDAAQKQIGFWVPLCSQQRSPLFVPIAANSQVMSRVSPTLIDMMIAVAAGAAGAFVLFLTNLVSIILAASLVFVLTGFALVAKLQENQEKVKTVIITVVLSAMIIMIPLAFTSEGILTSASRQSTAQIVTEAWLAEEDSLRLNRVQVEGDVVNVVITGEGGIPSIAELDESLSSAFGAPATAVVEFFPTERLTAVNQP